MSIYYFEDQSGTFFSEDGKRRFIMLTGQAAYQYMKQHRPGGVYFIQTVTDETDGEKVYVEVPKSSVNVIRREDNHGQYLSRMKRKNPYVFYSLDEVTDNDEDKPDFSNSMMTDNGHSVEEAVIHEIELEMLRRGLKSLTDEELKIIHSLYLSERPIAESRLCKELSIPRSTLRYRKKMIFEKLKKYF